MINFIFLSNYNNDDKDNDDDDDDNDLPNTFDLLLGHIIRNSHWS